MPATSFDRELLGYLTPEELAELDRLLASDPMPWRPLPGPQLDAYTSAADVIGYGGSAGGGKGLALDTPLPTPTGWKTMGEVQIGDVLFDEGGQPCQVTAVSNVNHRACYRLTFDDGSALVADDVHRWVTFDAKEMAAVAARNSARAAATVPAPPPQGTMRDTAALAATLRTASGRTNHAIRVAGALQTDDCFLPVPAYTLGAWLGDGASRNGQLTSVDPEVWQRVEADGFEVRHYAWDDKQHSIIGLAVRLRDLGVLESKHIPQRYLRAPYAQRLALLQGLMDTDGHAALDGGCEFDNTNHRLACGVLELVRSLGIKATFQHGEAKLSGRVVGPKWRVKFTTTLPVFGLARKRARLRSTTRRTAQFRYLVACEPEPSVPTRCIAVDSPSRQYLAGPAMVPTHNTDLIAGLALCEHQRSLIIRREKAQTEGVVQRLTEIVGGTTGYNSQKSIWRLPAGMGGIVEFGGLDNPGDERRWQGRPHDLKAFDEVTEMREDQVRFVMGWTRTNDPNQRTRVLMTFNPPTTAEGRWVIAFFAPWLDKQHPLYPTPAGALRWAAMIPGADGKTTDVWVENGEPFVLVDGKPCYEFDSSKFTPEQIIHPKSRTFIPARVTDNPYYVDSGYIATLQALPEPLRSQMLFGDFQAGIEDDPWQVVPTAWVEAAQARWRRPDRLAPMDSMGVDVSRGGKDDTVVARRHGMWFDEPEARSGKDTDTGPKVAGHVLGLRRDGAVIHLDVIGVGASPYDFLREARAQVEGVNVAEAATRTDKSGRLRFFNLRSQMWWLMREALDPANNTGIALPPAPRLKTDLCAPRWSLSSASVKVESREDIIKRTGKSPDYGTAYCLALMDTPKTEALLAAFGERPASFDHDPYA